MPETHTIVFHGHKMTAVLDHKTACDIIRVAGFQPPQIPSGSNSATMLFKTAGGKHAIAANQTGFPRQASDNEQEVNGCAAIILESDASDDEAKRILEKFANEMLK